jgi:hypothetical protein
MTLANELGSPLIGTTYEKPPLHIQPGFSFLHLQKLILLNPAVPERTCEDKDDILSNLGLRSGFYVSNRTPIG